MADRPELAVTPAALRAIVAIGAFHDRDAVRALLGQAYGVVIPTTPRVVEAGTVAVSCLAPGRYLASGDRASGLPARLTVLLDGIAAVTDQSDLWRTWRITGPTAPDLLARLLPIDLDPAVFRAGDLALTRLGHLDCRVWRLSAEIYELAVARSYADDLVHALRLAGAPVRE